MTKRRLYRHFVAPLAVLIAVFCTSVGSARVAAAASDKAVTDAPIDAIQAGDFAFHSGKFETATVEWTRAVEAASAAGNQESLVNALARRAEAYRALGFPARSEEDLKAALAMIKGSGGELEARLRGSLGATYATAGSAELAIAELQAGLDFAVKAENQQLEAVMLNNLGNLLGAQDQFKQAEAAFKRTGLLAVATGNGELEWVSVLNTARLYVRRGDAEQAETLLRNAAKGFAALPASARKATGLTSIARLVMQLEETAQQTDPARRRLAYGVLQDALKTAYAIDNQRSEAYAVGYMGELYERAGRLDGALRLTRRALHLSQRLDAPEILFLWQWQVGRIKKQLGDTTAALAAYRGAVDTVRTIRGDMLVGFGGGRSPFQTTVRPLILGLADLLLETSGDISDGEERLARLRDARQTVELLKAAELEDYYQDSCVAALRAKERSVEDLSAGTAAIYPIVLPDRVELLVSIGDKMIRKSVAVDEVTLRAQVAAFRHNLEKRTTRQYLRPAKILHGWLIAPILDELRAQKTDTLVIIPSGILNTIPFAALHDGKRHVIEDFAVAITPGLTLIESPGIAKSDANIMLTGITQSVQGFPALPAVASEIQTIESIVGGTVFLDENFLLDSFRVQLVEKSHTIVHIASHAEIRADAKNSFLLTFDERMTMDKLEQFVKPSLFRDEPLELLTLSACETAAGDERAALGLAGIAIKAGARSALASLWSINDQTSADLVGQFYQNLTKGGLTKAKALQAAQRGIMADRRHRHPGYWAPFLLIGNWI